jgi:hypothetical protein
MRLARPTWHGGAGLIAALAPLLTSAVCSQAAFAQQLIRAAPGVNAQLARLQFRIVGGRLQATNDTPGGRLGFQARSLGREETLTVDLSGPFPSVDYAITTRKSRVQIVISDGQRASASCQPHPRSTVVAMQFEQSPGLPLVLRVGAEGDQRQFQAASLWHLFLSEPEVASKHLTPILNVLRPDWRLDEQAAEIERRLIDLAAVYHPPDQAKLAALVEQLGHEDFGARQRAERSLREMGTAAVGYLRTLPAEALDAEQRFRVRRIVASLWSADEEDQPPQAAQRLQHDPEVWLALWARPDATRRHVAARHLGRLLGHEIELELALDPAAREEQLARLRAQFDRRDEP